MIHAESRLLQQIARSLSVALEARDSYTRLHSDRVVLLSGEFGRHLGLNGAELSQLALGAQFHDLGKIGIPDCVLRKPLPFDADEWECMKQHVVIGEQIVRSIEGLHADELALTVRHHHEHFDGSGYPDGLGGTAIPLYSRLISLVDSYDAIAGSRPYHPERNHRMVMDIIERESGSKHDPALMAIFHSVIEKSALRVTDN